MRSDAKLGLALGILVIGFAIAFCYPREGRVSVVDQIIQPRTNSQESNIEFVPIRKLRQQSESPPPVVVEVHQNARRESSVPASVGPKVAVPNRAHTVGKPAPEFQSSTGLKELLKSEPLTAKSSEPARSSATQEPESQPIEPAFVTYQVQANDTLSGISLKTLGSYRRYLEIFAANEDRLKSPDDIHLGQELRIPVDSSGADLATGNPEASAEVLPEVQPSAEPGDDGEPPKRFQGSQSAPFLSNRKPEMPVHQIQPRSVATHVVQPGETLEQIAVTYFGTTRGIQQLREANPQIARNPRLFQPGMILRLVPSSSH